MKYILLLFLVVNFLAPVSAETDKQKSIREFLSNAEKNGYSGTILVAEKGQLIYEDGIGLADREQNRRQTAATVFSIGSITKQFTAAAIMKLEADGKLTTNDKLSKFFPDAPSDKKDITLHQLLTHTAGFKDALGDDYDTIHANEFIRLAFALPLVKAPGESFHYSNVGFSILAIIVEKVSGMGYENFLREKIWLPSGMTQTGYVLPHFTNDQLAIGYRDGQRWGSALEQPWMTDGPGWHLRGNGGILSTVGDMYRWYLSIKNFKVLPREQTGKMFSPQVQEGDGLPGHYGYGWSIRPTGKATLIWHNGGNGVYNAIMSFNLADDICIIVSSNTNQTVSDRIAAGLYNLVVGEEIFKIKNEEPDYRNNPVSKKILASLNEKGADYFSMHYKEMLTSAGFGFEDDMVLLGVGEQLEEQKKWKEGVALYKAYTNLFPEIVVAWNRLGKCYKNTGEADQAKACWEKSASLRATNNPAVSWLKAMK